MYKEEADVGFVLRLYAESDPPTFSGGSWSTANAHKTSQFSQYGDLEHESQHIYAGFYVHHVELPINGVYRLWVQVDPSSSVAETDEGDNMFPTNVRVFRM